MARKALRKITYWTWTFRLRCRRLEFWRTCPFHAQKFYSIQIKLYSIGRWGNEIVAGRRSLGKEEEDASISMPTANSG